MLRAASFLSVTALALVAGCSSMSNGSVAVEARGNSPAALEALAILLGAYGSGGGYESSASAGRGGTVVYGSFDSNTLVRSAGLQAAINTPLVDVVGGIDKHWFHDQGVSETSIGLRKRFEQSDSGATYVEVLERRGSGIDTRSGQQDYDGLAIGIGCIGQLGEHWFVDISIEYERTLRRLDVSGDDPHLSDILLSVGLGFSL